MKTDQIEADDREHALKFYSERNISIVKLVLASSQKKDNDATSKKNLLLLGTLFLVISVVAFLFLKKQDVPDPEPLTTKNTSIARINSKPYKIHQDITNHNSKVTSQKKKRPVVTTKTYVDENGIERYPGGARVPRKNPPILKMPDRRAVQWKFDAEDEICTLLQAEPGDVMIGEHLVDQRFVDDFKESLKVEIRITEDDDWYQRQLKEDMIAAKKDLKEALDRGEDIAKILNDTRQELRSLYEYKSDLLARMNEILSTSLSSYSEQDVSDLTDAVNKLLTEKGIRPIKMPRSILRRLKRMSGKIKN